LLPVWNYEIASGVMKFGSDAKNAGPGWLTKLLNT
jgi:hypothetical protein